MTSETTAQQSVRVIARNVGGIDDTEVSFSPGVAVLVGRNATNRTSFLQAIMAVLGSENASLKGDAEQGHVQMDLADGTYSRTLTRQNGVVTFGGDPYLADPELADLFAFLLENNEARRAVARNDDLRELIMRPVDTAAIEDEIEHLKDERETIEDDLADVRHQKEVLPTLEEERASLDEEIASVREDLEETMADIDGVDADITASREGQLSDLESTLDTLQSTRSDLADVRYDIDTQRESIEDLQAERADLRAERDDVPTMADDRLADIEDRLAALRARRDELEGELSQLQNLVQFNEEMLDDPGNDAFDALRGDGGAAELTDQLLDDQEVACWTCGSRVTVDEIESTVDRLRTLHRETLDESKDLEETIADLKSERDRLEEHRRRRAEIDDRLTTIESDIEEREERVATLRERRDDLREQIEALEDDVAQLERDDYGDLLDLHREANELEFDLERLESEREEVTDRIASVEADLDREPRLEEELDSVTDELETLRTRIERIEADSIEQFNDHMATVLDLLDYANLERIWLERVERETRDGRRTVDEEVFELHVVRSTASGTVYEDTVDHLSESEREVTGLVFALAGYLVHEVYESVPFMLLDSLEAIDSDRIAALVDYFEGYAPNIVVALLPEDAAALDDDYQRLVDL